MSKGFMCGHLAKKKKKKKKKKEEEEKKKRRSERSCLFNKQITYNDTYDVLTLLGVQRFYVRPTVRLMLLLLLLLLLVVAEVSGKGVYLVECDHKKSSDHDQKDEQYSSAGY